MKYTFAAFCLCGLITLAAPARAADPWLTIPGGDGPGHGKRVVLISGDDEYRSEVMLPQLALILARRHGFDCTVLFAIDPKDGTINPDIQNNIPGLESLRKADLMILFTRMRKLPDEQMKEIVDYVDSGRPIVGVRTATHAFANPPGTTYARFDWESKEAGWEGGFGRRVLGETWVDHHGHHGSQSTRGIVAPGAADHPILRGIKDGDIWGPTDVYKLHLPLPESCHTLVLGQVLSGMKRDDPPVAGEQNDPMMPIAWTNTYTGAAGKPARVFTSTIGASQDISNEGVRRLLVNACYWCVGLEEKITPQIDVNLIGKYHGIPFGFGGFARGVKPADINVKTTF